MVIDYSHWEDKKVIHLDSSDVDFLSLQNSVLEYFKSHPQMTFSSSQIESYFSRLGCLGNSVSRALRKFVKDEKLLKISRGYYKYKKVN